MPRTFEAELPGLVEQSLAETIAEFQRREFDLGDSLRSYYHPLFEDYRNELERYFLKHFYKSLNEEKEPVWDFAIANKLDTVDELTDSMVDLLESAEEEASDLLNEDLVGGFWEASDRELWLLAQSGVDVSRIGDPWSFAEVQALLLAAGIGATGLSYAQRLSRWTAVYKGKFKHFFLAAVIGGLTLDSTLIGYDSLRKGVVTSVVGLAQNELKNAFTAGSQQVRKEFKDDIEGEVWITREDVLVCQTCAKLHLTITKKQPIKDSHPNCRCNKAPIVLNYRGEPKDYVSFLQSIGRR